MSTTSNGNDVLIQLESVAKVFYTDEMETHALADVHLSITRGEYVSIEGPSGSGKTTLLSILGLLDTPTRGQYLLGGQPAANLKGRERALLRNRQIGFIFQSFNLIGDLTVFENVELPLTYRGLPSAERKKRVEAALERVAVARAVAGDPLVLLADEPTGNLDSKNGDAVMGLLRELHAAGATICMVTHNPEYAKQATRSINLFDGRVVDETRNAASAGE